MSDEELDFRWTLYAWRMWLLQYLMLYLSKDLFWHHTTPVFGAHVVTWILGLIYLAIGFHVDNRRLRR